MPAVKSSILVIASKMSWSDWRGSSKDKDGFPLGAWADLVLEHGAVREVNARVKQSGDLAFQTGFVEKRKPSGGVEVGHKVDVRPGGVVAAGLRAEQAQNERCRLYAGRARGRGVWR